MAAARVTRAQEAQAPLYAADLFQEAQVSLTEARRALDAGNYRGAIQAATHACLRADEARLLGAKEKRRLSREAERLLREAQALLDEARYLGAHRAHAGEVESFTDRHRLLRQALEGEQILDAHEGGTLLKSDLLALLKTLER
ncbi:MAG: hypothetical protein ACE5JI_04425 [Acidobacteriota bacterium]